MNKKIIKEWIAALRSNKYIQGTGCLRSRDNKFCCLGVLCDIVDDEGWEISSGGATFTHYNGASTYLPTEIAEKVFGNPLDTNGRRIFKTDLGTINDKGATFKEIADLIEKEIDD